MTDKNQVIITPYAIIGYIDESTPCGRAKAKQVKADMETLATMLQDTNLSTATKNGNLFMLHTGKSGRHTVTLPEEMKGRKVVELFSGKEYPIENIRMHTQGSNTWLFQIKENK